MNKGRRHQKTEREEKRSCYSCMEAEPGGDRSEAWDRETMFSQLAKRSSQNVDSGVRNNKYFRSTRIVIAINLFGIVYKIQVYFVWGK